MSRYVDAEWLLGVAKLSNGTVDIDDIYNAPSIDICFCRECEHWSKYRTDGNQSYCEILGGYCDGDKYCAWGKRSKR